MTIALVEPGATDVKVVVDPGASGAAATDWRATLPEEIRGDPVLAQYKTPEDAHRGHIEAAKTIGKKTEGMFRVPGADAKPEEVAAYHKAIGVPEKPEGYSITLPDDLKAMVHPERLEGFKPLFHKYGVTAAAAQGLTQALAEANQKALVEYNQANLAKVDEWKQQIGEPAYTRKEALAQRFVKSLGDESALGPAFLTEFADHLDKTGLTNHPLWVKLSAYLGEQFAQEGHIDGTVTGIGSLEEAQQWLEQYKTDPKHPARDPKHPWHEAALVKKAQIFKFLYPGTGP